MGAPERMKIEWTVPRVIEDALTEPKHDYSYISRNTKIGSGPEADEGERYLDSGNHAFYMGKFFPSSLAERAANIAGWKIGRDRIYSAEFILGALDYLQAHIVEGEKIQFYICPELSALFNGTDDIEGALDVEEQKAFIRKLAAGPPLEIDPERLEIKSFDEVPGQERLFAKLREAVDPESGRLDITQVFGDEVPEISADSDSYEIAQLLHHACTESPALNQLFQKTVPKKINEDEEKRDLAKYYGLCEVAIRIVDVLHGREIHGGVSRQGLYDNIIEKLMKGRDRRMRNLDILKPLYEICKGRNFVTLHMTNELNYHQIRANSVRAKTRMLIYAVLLLGSVLGAYELGVQSERKRKEQSRALIEERIEGELEDVVFRVQPKITLEREHNLQTFENIVRDMKLELTIRYGVEMDEDNGDIHALIEEYLLKNKGMMVNAYANPKRMYELIDLFVIDHSIYFTEKGYRLDRPYPQLKQYENLFARAEKNKQDVSVPAFRPSHQVLAWSREHIGVINEENGVYTYELFREGNVLFARNWKGASHISTKKAAEAAKAYRRIQRKFDALKLNRKIKEFVNSPSPEQEIRVEDKSYIVVRLPDYEDYFGEFHYELGIFSRWNEQYHRSDHFLVAREPGEQFFSSEKAKEVTTLFKENYY